MAAPAYTEKKSAVENLQLLLISMLSTVVPQATFENVIAQLLHYVHGTAAIFSGTLQVVGKLTLGTSVVESVDTISAAGAVSVATISTKLATAGAIAITLADGVEGQLKRITMITDGGDAVLTPTTKTGFTTLTFGDVGDSVTLQFFTTKGWMVLSNNGVAVA